MVAIHQIPSPPPLSAEDRLRIHAAVQTEWGRTWDLAELICSLAEVVGVREALVEFNRAVSHPLLGDVQPAN